MVELAMNGQVYSFNFGIGFLREMNKKVSVPVDGAPGVKKNIGFKYYAAELLDGDVEALIEILDTANRGQEPRLTRMALDAYIDSADTDIEGLFEKVKDFLLNSNASKKEMQTIVEAVEKEKAKAAAQR